MSKYLFGVQSGKLSKKEVDDRHRVAKKHGAKFIYTDMPEGTKSWFCCDNLGHPFDQAIENAVEQELTLCNKQ